MSADPGTRPGLHSQTLISTGQADLDRLLGGGLPLGTVLLILEDAATQHHATLLRYFVAEGVACGHQVHWAVPQRHEDPYKALPQLATSTSRTNEDGEEEKQDSGLRIAWQYRRYIQGKQKEASAAAAAPKKSGSAFQRKQPGVPSGGPVRTPSASGLRDWCHTFDLTRPMRHDAESRLVCQQHSGPDSTDSLVRAAQALATSTASPSTTKIHAAAAPPAYGPSRQAIPQGPGPEPPGTETASLSASEAVSSPQQGVSQGAGPSGPESASHSASEAASSQQAASHRPGQSGTESAPHSASEAVSSPQQAASQGPRPSGTESASGSASDAVSSLSLGPARDFRSALAAPELPSTTSISAFKPRGRVSMRPAADVAVAPSLGGTATSSSARSSSHTPADPQPPTAAIGTSAEGHAPSSQPQNSRLPSSFTGMGRRSIPARSSALPNAAVPVSQRAAPAARGPESIGRLAVQSLGSLQWGSDPADAEEPARLWRTVFRLKATVRGSRCAAMISVPAGMYGESCAQRLQHLCDAVLVLEPVTDGSHIVRLVPDPASVCGVLHVKKLPGLNTLAPPAPPVSLFVIRHKRRRIALEPFEVDPDAEAALASEGGGTSPAAALMCGGPPKADKAFDY